MNKATDKREEKLDFRILLADLGGKLKRYYPYFLVFYILCLLISRQMEDWRFLFFWPGLHSSFVVATCLFLFLSVSGRRSYFLKPFRDSAFFIASCARFGLGFLKDNFSRLSPRAKVILAIKVLIIALSLVLARSRGASPVEFSILVYALASVLFSLDSRISSGIALFFLVSCPVLIFMEKGKLAETSAIYAYYFLIITVLTEIGRLCRGNNSVKAEPDSKKSDS